MAKKIKLAAASALAVILAALAVYLYINISETSSLSAALPAPRETRPYVLAEFSSDNFPGKITALMSDEAGGVIKQGSSASLLLAFMHEAESTALLAELSEDRSLSLFASMFFKPEDQKSLKKGNIPSSWKKLQPVTISRGQTRGSWVITDNQTANTLYYSFSSGRMIAARTEKELSLMESVKAKNLPSAGTSGWKKDSGASANAEFSDGGMALSSGDKVRPVKLRVSWSSLAGAAGTPRGRLDWEIAVSRFAGIFSNFTPVVWGGETTLVTTPPVVTVGLNIPELPQSFEKWPLPLKTIGAFAKSLELSPKQTSRAISGKSVFTVGGENSILWLTLPGFLMQFTGEEEDMRALVSAFWEKIFFGAEPVPVKDFTYGGMATLPFSTIGAGNETMSVFGLVSENSVKQEKLSLPFLRKDEPAIGWISADMKNVAEALLKMTEVNSFSANRETPSIFDSEEVPSEEDFSGEEPFQPEMALTPFDRFITKDFCSRLAELGRLAFVWEKPLSGRIVWY